MEKNELLSTIQSSQQIDLLKLKKKYRLEELIEALNSLQNNDFEEITANPLFVENFLDLMTFIYSLINLQKYSEPNLTKSSVDAPKIKDKVNKQVFNMSL